MNFSFVKFAIFFALAVFMAATPWAEAVIGLHAPTGSMQFSSMAGQAESKLTEERLQAILAKSPDASSQLQFLWQLDTLFEDSDDLESEIIVLNVFAPLLERTAPKSDVRISRAYGKLVVLCAYLGYYESAERSAIKSVAAARIARPFDPAGLSVMINNLGMVEEHRHKYAAAEYHYLQALETMRSYKVAPVIRGMTELNLAELYASGGRSNESGRYFRLAIESLRKTYGDGDELLKKVRTRYRETRMQGKPTRRQTS